MPVSLSCAFAHLCLLGVALQVPVMHLESHYARSIFELSSSCAEFCGKEHAE
jgi:hypothetical protein